MKKCQTENQNRDSYQTGKTVPPKNYQGMITVLLILIIFLGGIVSALSMLNMRLFRMLESQNNSAEDSSLQFSRKTEALPESVRDGVEIPALGLTGQEVTELCRSYYGWPEGLYISGLTPAGPAAKANLCQGDILVALDGVIMDSEDDLAAAVSQKNSGDVLVATVFRGGTRMTIRLILE